MGHESLRRWVAQADIDAGDREGVTSVEAAEIRRLKAQNKRLREDVAILKAATACLSWGNSTPQPLIMGFIDQIRAEGRAVESIIRILGEQGVKVAARTYRAWRQGRVAAGPSPTRSSSTRSETLSGPPSHCRTARPGGLSRSLCK